MPYFQEIKEVNDLLAANPDMTNEAAEESLEALVSFNKDMKTLALNAYQMQELTSLAMQENDLMLEWLAAMETSTLKVEDDLTRMAGIVKAVCRKQIK